MTPIGLFQFYNQRSQGLSLAVSANSVVFLPLLRFVALFARKANASKA